jgi:hypothetical protein
LIAIKFRKKNWKKNFFKNKTKYLVEFIEICELKMN